MFISKRKVRRLLDELDTEYDAQLSKLDKPGQREHMYFLYLGKAQATWRIRRRLGLGGYF